jgi:hypothetical protein
MRRVWCGAEVTRKASCLNEQHAWRQRHLQHMLACWGLLPVQERSYGELGRAQLAAAHEIID